VVVGYVYRYGSRRFKDMVAVVSTIAVPLRRRF
jgi:hypothetical protein